MNVLTLWEYQDERYTTWLINLDATPEDDQQALATLIEQHTDDRWWALEPADIEHETIDFIMNIWPPNSHVTYIEGISFQNNPPASLNALSNGAILDYQIQQPAEPAENPTEPSDNNPEPS